MLYGLLQFSTDDGMHPCELARAAEERGFESLLFPEHTHIPVSRKSPWPGGKQLPREYSHTNDLFVALAMAAAATEKLKVGSGICLVVERDPIVLAKEVATLDSLSNGRLLFGIGGGWNAEEMENHGTNFRARWAILRERVEAMKAIWTQDEASYLGEHVSFDAIWSWPKPAQKPHPPILLGTGSARGRQRVVEYCDGWMPIAGRDDIVAGVEDLWRRADAAGRPRDSLSVTVFGAPAKPETLERYRAAGIARAVFGLPPKGRDEVLPMMDRYAELVRSLA
ncbi:MAG TPA: LLM class F420-dependent oxidoreductase [Candidatus Binatia bacterium]|nr:LLM class F420-dependent oxidoreductase [Candidatus Binatia bacterium]